MQVFAAQAQYQVRFEWGAAGLAAIAPGAHVIVWVDAVPGVAPDPLTRPHPAAVVTGSTGSASAVAAWVLELQAQLADRAVVAVVAAGGEHGRFAVEDLLGAGAVIDALAEVGIDSCSPEAASAAAAFQGLRTAAGHMLTACAAGRALAASGGADAVRAAREANESTLFRVLREYSPSA